MGDPTLPASDPVLGIVPVKNEDSVTNPLNKPVSKPDQPPVKLVYQSRHLFALAELYGDVVKGMGLKTPSQQDRLYHLFEKHARDKSKNFNASLFHRVCMSEAKERLE